MGLYRGLSALLLLGSPPDGMGMEILQVTHFVPWTGREMGRDYVLSACGKGMHIKHYSSQPTCQDPRCQTGAKAHRLKLKAEALKRGRG